MYELRNFRVPPGFRGRNAIIVQLWWICQKLFFSLSPQIFYPWRNFLLRLFGAKIGRGVIIRPSAKITYPWKLKIGDYSWIGDEVVLYTLDEISIGDNSIISQRSYLCTGSHDFDSNYFDINSKPIIIGSSCWLATDVFVAPGVIIENDCVIGARSSVYKSIPRDSICYGNPATVVRKKRNLIKSQ